MVEDREGGVEVSAEGFAEREGLVLHAKFNEGKGDAKRGLK